MALVCVCSLAGTEACKSCGRYIEAFGKPEPNIDSLLDGEYRVIDGELFRKVKGSNPFLKPKDKPVFGETISIPTVWTGTYTIPEYKVTTDSNQEQWTVFNDRS